MCFRIKRRRRRSTWLARKKAIAAVNAAAAAAPPPPTTATAAAPMATPKSDEKPAGSKASWPSITTWREFGVAAALVLLLCAIFAFAPDMRLLLKGVLGEKTLQTPEDCIANIMLYEPLNIVLPESYIAREGLFPPLSDAPFQHWDGPKTIGKSTEAHHLALTEKAKGNPVLYLSYKVTTSSVFEAFGACFEDSITQPNKLNDNRQKALMNTLGMFRKETSTRGPFLRYWYNLFPSGTHPYDGDGLPLLIIDDLNLATQEDARRWTVLGREGKFSHRYRTVLLTSPGPSRTNVRQVSDIMTAKLVTFRDFTWHETQRLLHDLGIADEQRVCEIWHVVGGRPGDLASVKESLGSTKSTRDIEIWRETLIVAARISYTITQDRLPEKLQADIRTMCKTLAQMLTGDSSDRCVSISELARECGINDVKTDDYWGSVLNKIINAGSVLWLQYGRCVRFETKPMQDYASSVLASLQLTNLSTVKCLHPAPSSAQCSNLPGTCEP